MEADNFDITNRRSLRPLLPSAPGPQVECSAVGHSNPGASSFSSVPYSSVKKRPTAIAACQACRKRKSKCDAQRPCSACSSHDTECFYETLNDETHSQALKRKFTDLQSQISAYEQIYDMLQNRPTNEAAAIFRRIRTGADNEAILRHVRDGDLLLQVSLIPETRHRYELPDNPKMPAHLHQEIENPYLESLIYEWTLPGNDLPQARQKGPAIAEPMSAYLKPFIATELIEPLLSEANISNWTVVTSNDALLNDLMQRYFLQQYQFWPFFPKDYFLEDLRASRKRFCSSLLVNAILADACHSHSRIRSRNEHWNPEKLGYQFLVEARRLWELETGKAKVTTIQAALVMLMVFNIDGLDKVGWSYLGQAIQMAYDLNLFNSMPVKSKKMQTVREFTAWALFNWQVISTFHYHLPPLIANPPEAKPPDPAVHHKWYSEIWVKYPTSQTLVPTHHAEVVYSICQFRSILNEVSSEAWGGSQKGLNLEQTLEYYKRFKNWLDDLPKSLEPLNIVLPSHLQLHIHYYNVVMALFQSHAPVTPGAATSRDTEMSPERILAEAKARLETLMRLLLSSTRL